MKNSLLGLNSRCEQAEESDLKWKKRKISKKPNRLHKNRLKNTHTQTHHKLSKVKYSKQQERSNSLCSSDS